MTFAAIFSLLVGVGMIGQWTASFVAKQIPELKDEPIRIWFHIVAEMVTALALIAAGLGLLFKQGWGVDLYLVASGMLLYTAIVSPGYFAQKGQWGWLGMFAVVIVLALIGLLLVV